jgi:8-oxo-dGTP pyrophosphatase MutT (NUDIX family)
VTARRARAREERSAGGVVLRRIRGELHVLVIRDPYKNWGLPKGHLEDGEDSRAAALREVREETGLETLEMGPELGTIDWYFRAGATLVHKYCDFFLMASPRGTPVPEEAEGISEAVWVPLLEAPGRISYDNARRIVDQALELVSDGAALDLELGPETEDTAVGLDPDAAP